MDLLATLAAMDPEGEIARGLATQVEAAKVAAEGAEERAEKYEKLNEKIAEFQASEEYTRQEGEWY